MTQNAEDKFKNKTIIYNFVKERGETTVRELIDNLGLSNQLIVFHLTSLEKAGMVGRKADKHRKKVTEWFPVNDVKVDHGLLVKQVDMGTPWLNRMMGYRQDFNPLVGRVIRGVSFR